MQTQKTNIMKKLILILLLSSFTIMSTYASSFSTIGSSKGNTESSSLVKKQRVNINKGNKRMKAGKKNLHKMSKQTSSKRKRAKHSRKSCSAYNY